MSSNKRLFEEQDHALLYKKYRPSYDQKLIGRIIQFLNEKHSGPYDLAIDVGCGTGQATKLLCDYFKDVKGFDISENQIEQAKCLEVEHENLKFYTSPCEQLDLHDVSVDLILAANALHWFNLDLFFQECKRILKPTGVLAFFTNKELTIVHKDSGEALTRRLHAFRSALIPFENEVLTLVRNGYETIHPPFAQILRDDSLVDDLNWSLTDFVNYVQTWSYYRSYETENKDGKLLESFVNDMQKILGFGAESVLMLFRRKIALILCSM
jgi:SAM-dependent methyltransferase